MNRLNKIEVYLKHDAGSVKITTWAQSIEEAISNVLKAENAPNRAVKKAQVVRPTIYDIKEATKETAPHFFTRESMRFWGQKMSDFRIQRTGPHTFYIEARHQHGKTRRIYDAFLGTLQQVND